MICEFIKKTNVNNILFKTKHKIKSLKSFIVHIKTSKFKLN